MVRTHYFPCHGMGSIPGRGTKVPVWLSVQPGVLGVGAGPLVGGAGSLVLIH